MDQSKEKNRACGNKHGYLQENDIDDMYRKTECTRCGMIVKAANFCNKCGNQLKSNPVIIKYKQ